ncbi:MAG: Rnase Y domain-containing protein, partial [bacterium]|nr:Rnase Y domain-containing protein [bacterium]
MFSGLNPLITAVSALLPGLVIGYLVRHLVASRKVTLAESKAEATLADSKAKSQDIILEAKNNAFKILEEAKKEEKERNSQLSRIENILTKKENELEQKGQELSSEKETLKHKAVELTTLKGELEKSRETQLKELERISGLDREKAKIELVAKTEEEYRDDLYKRMRKLENENRDELEKKAKEIVTMAVQRYASSQIADTMTTVVSLPSDEVKGKIIGKEGRNIKAIERLTGVDIIIDDTPEALVVSGFDPVRRQIAKLAIDKLIADGRIHPAKIEEMVEKAKSEINEK